MLEFAKTTPANGKNKKKKPMQQSKVFKRLPNTHTKKRKEKNQDLEFE